MSGFRGILKLVGKGESKVAAVFGTTPESCHRAVVHLREGAPGIPVLLFATQKPALETIALCESVMVRRSSLRLAAEAYRMLWPHWVALSVAPWQGGHGRWPLKLAPFFIPPFRVLIQNRSGDFFPGTPPAMVRHLGRVSRDAADGLWNALRTAAHAIGDVRRGATHRLSGATLQAVGTVLGWSGYPHCRMFERLHGSEVLPVDVPPAAGGGVLRIESAGPRWDGESLERAARASDAKWILWGRGDVCEPPFDDPLTFAVSQQQYFRAWKAMMMYTAPFRVLEPGEFSRVTAPVADTILVDRAKLLALGIPRTSLAVTAWMLIFWKAAAAGWRSYSAGQSRPLTEQPDFPMQDAAFLLKLLSDPALRRLAPRELELSRGCIASARRLAGENSVGQLQPLAEQPDFPMQLRSDPALRRLAPREPELSRGCIASTYGLAGAGLRPNGAGQSQPLAELPREPELSRGFARGPAAGGSRLKVLLVTPFLPYPLSHGGAVRIYNLCRALADRVDFSLVALREKDDRVEYGKLHEIFREVHIVDIDERASRDQRLPVQVRGHQSRAMRALIADIARRWRPELLQFEYTHMAAFRDAAPEVPAILVEHDLTFHLYRQLAANKPSADADAEYRRWLTFEQHWLRVYDGVWTVSEEDCATVVRDVARAVDRTFNIPNGVDVRRFTPGDAPATHPEVFYVGSFRHLPNILGFDKLRREVMPRVWQEFPEARLRVVAGPRHEDYWKDPGDLDRRIEIHGFVEDLRPLYARATVVAVPLEVSAGTNIKVLEAMACGKAVVSTAVGCAGLGLHDGEDAIVRDSAEDFARAVCGLLGDAAARQRIATAARRTVEQRYSWDAIADAAFASYRAIHSSTLR